MHYVLYDVHQLVPRYYFYTIQLHSAYYRWDNCFCSPMPFFFNCPRLVLLKDYVVSLYLSCDFTQFKCLHLNAKWAKYVLCSLKSSCNCPCLESLKH